MEILYVQMIRDIKGLENFEGKITVSNKHKIDKDFLIYHFQQYKKNN